MYPSLLLVCTTKPCLRYFIVPCIEVLLRVPRKYRCIPFTVYPACGTSEYQCTMRKYIHVPYIPRFRGICKMCHNCSVVKCKEVHVSVGGRGFSGRKVGGGGGGMIDEHIFSVERNPKTVLTCSLRFHILNPAIVSACNANGVEVTVFDKKKLWQCMPF